MSACATDTQGVRELHPGGIPSGGSLLDALCRLNAHAEVAGLNLALLTRAARVARGVALGGRLLLTEEQIPLYAALDNSAAQRISALPYLLFHIELRTPLMGLAIDDLEERELARHGLEVLDMVTRATDPVTASILLGMPKAAVDQWAGMSDATKAGWVKSGCALFKPRILPTAEYVGAATPVDLRLIAMRALTRSILSATEERGLPC